MASTPVFSFRPPGIQVCSASGRRSSGSNKPGNWWTPIFGWAPEPDYIDAAAGSAYEKPNQQGSGRRFAAFTEEKARQLRIKTVESSNFHDVMYHSAIASRLASDFTTHFESD